MYIKSSALTKKAQKNETNGRRSGMRDANTRTMNSEFHLCQWHRSHHRMTFVIYVQFFLFTNLTTKNKKAKEKKRTGIKWKMHVKKMRIC